MGIELTMGARTEITRKFARQYARCSKKDKGRVLDEVVLVTGRSRDNARRRLAAAAKPGPRLVKPARKQRERKYSYDATKSAPEGLASIFHDGPVWGWSAPVASRLF